MGEESKKNSKPRSREYPAYTLDESIEFVSKFKNFPTGKPISYAAAAKEIGVSPTTKSFKYTLSAARQYGLISTGTGSTFTLLPSANRLIRPTESETALQQLRVECFQNPKIYNELISQYKGQSLPPVNTLENVLVNFHGVLSNVAKMAAQTFIDSANELGIVVNGVIDVDAANEPSQPVTDSSPQKTETAITDDPVAGIISEKALRPDEFAAPLTVPLGEHRKAILYMPIDAEKDDAEYVRDMIAIMFKRLYGVEASHPSQP